MSQTYVHLVIFAIVWLVEINSFPLDDSDDDVTMPDLSYLGTRVYR